MYERGEYLGNMGETEAPLVTEINGVLLLFQPMPIFFLTKRILF